MSDAKSVRCRLLHVGHHTDLSSLTKIALSGMSFTNQSNPKENPWYPRHVSDRVDELLDDLDETQSRQLYDELKKITLGDWFAWLEDTRNEVSKYDSLSRAKRRQRLAKSASVADLKLHHACVFVELWRTRTTNAFFSLPPSGAPLDTDENQREMMLAVVSSYNNFEFRDLWPFEFPNDVALLPFLEA